MTYEEVKECKQHLELLKAEIEWDKPIGYQIDLDLAIEALENQKLYEHLYFQIGEALVDVSKCDISPEYCIEKIRNVMKEFDYAKIGVIENDIRRGKKRNKNIYELPKR